MGLLVQQSQGGLTSGPSSEKKWVSPPS